MSSEIRKVQVAEGASVTAPTDLSITSNSSDTLNNISIAASTGSGALTVSIKDKNGSTPSGSSPCDIGFRSSTETSGVYNIRSVTSAVSMVVSSGSTLATQSATESVVFVYAIDNAGVVELAVSTQLFSPNALFNTTAEGGAGGADDGRFLYSTTARTGVPIRLLGSIRSTQTTAGTWAQTLEVSSHPEFPLGVRSPSPNAGWLRGQIAGYLPASGSGYVGELIEASQTKSITGNDNTTANTDICSITLGVGIWLIHGAVWWAGSAVGGSSNSITYVIKGTAGTTEGKDIIRITALINQQLTATLPVRVVPVEATETKTFLLRTNVDRTQNANAHLTAVRIA